MAFFDPFGGSGSGGSGGGSGAPGKDGRGISSIVFVSSTGGSIAGIAGATDTYRINYTDGTTSTYTVKNGNNGEQGPKGDKGDPATAKIIETILLSTGWNEKQYTLTSDLIKENNYISISFGKNISSEQYDCLAKAKIICITQIDRQIILKSLGTVPNIDIPIIIVIEGEQIDTINNSILLTDDTTGETYKIGVDNGEVYSAKEIG